MKIRRHRLALTALLATAIVAAGCGSSSSGTKSPASATSATTTGAGAASTPTSTAPSTSGGGGAGSAAVTNYLTYVHGKGGTASGTPVTIGWINQQGGQQQVGPLATAGAETAVKYINAELGGIGGHPLALKECFIRTAEEEGTTCAQQMLADKAISVVDEGAVAIGIQSFYSTLAGAKPVIVGVSVTPIDSVQKNAVIYFGDPTHILAPFGTYAKQVLHANSASLIYPNIAGLTDGAKAISQGMKSAGVSLKEVSYDESNPDLIGPISSAGASSADLVIPYTDSSGCVNLAKGLKQVGISEAKKIVSAPLCLNGQVAAGLGGDFPIWTYAIASSLYGDTTDPGLAPYTKVMAKYSTPADAPDPWNLVAFAQVLTTARLLNQIGYGKIAPTAILTKAKAFTGPIALGAPQLQCGKYAAAPAVCNDRTQFFEYHGKHMFTKAASWLQPPS
ncbi:MAG: ABC transporter substrate-binding protein [Solirubrobacterales bacterium]|nr:ABC transporter substrate-binding protein [Solirubrobacterales bacterium]MBV9714509.1 ABC transporter substrate-binding protein [Solirubrobacterales bacterium]